MKNYVNINPYTMSEINETLNRYHQIYNVFLTSLGVILGFQFAAYAAIYTFATHLTPSALAIIIITSLLLVVECFVWLATIQIFLHATGCRYKAACAKKDNNIKDANNYWNKATQQEILCERLINILIILTGISFFILPLLLISLKY